MLIVNVVLGLAGICVLLWLWSREMEDEEYPF
jgi:hypothetical protein